MKAESLVKVSTKGRTVIPKEVHTHAVRTPYEKTGFYQGN